VPTAVDAGSRSHSGVAGGGKVANQKRAVVVGAGPNGLAAAVALAQAGIRVTVLEANDTIGGGTRTEELTLPGFRHDVCSAIHPLAAGSPFLRSLPLEQHGLRWIHPEVAVAHPFDDGSAATIERSLDQTAAGLGDDGEAYRSLMAPLAQDWKALASSVLGPVQRLPRHPIVLGRFGLQAMRSAAGLASAKFRRPATRALFTGLSAHANVKLTRPFSASFGLVLGSSAHAFGWPLAAGGSQTIADALASYCASLGVEFETGRCIGSLIDLPAAEAVLFDVTPRQLLSIAGDELSMGYRRSLHRYRYGPAVFKVDYALDGPVPWSAPDCGRAGTVHLGRSMEEILASEDQVAMGLHPQRPYVIVAQQSLFDPTRAPTGKHVLWTYCHVPNGSSFNMTERMEAQLERFAPGFRKLVLARHVTPPAALEAQNANYVGGDIAAGAHDGLQLFFRPGLRLSPYATSNRRLFLCSASTPPGAGVHGMCGYHAARAALKSALSGPSGST
jgi:phytoene dehydrogenase-like protein